MVSRYLLSTFFSTLVITLGPAPLLPGKPCQDDQNPDEPEQREECDATSAPVDCAKYIQTQTNQTRCAEDTVNASVNSHK